MFEATYEHGIGKDRVIGQLDGVEPPHQLGKEAVDFHPGQDCTETEVNTVAESEMFVRFSNDIEAEGFVEDFFVAVARCISKADRFARSDGYAADLGVRG